MDLAKLLLDEMSGGNTSGSVSAYEGMPTRRTPAQMLARRYGCDYKSDHHSRARCMLQGKLDQIKLALQKPLNPKERFKLQMKMATWQEKMQNEIRKSRYRKD